MAWSASTSLPHSIIILHIFTDNSRSSSITRLQYYPGEASQLISSPVRIFGKKRYPYLSILRHWIASTGEHARSQYFVLRVEAGVENVAGSMALVLLHIRVANTGYLKPTWAGHESPHIRMG